MRKKNQIHKPPDVYTHETYISTWESMFEGKRYPASSKRVRAAF